MKKIVFAYKEIFSLIWSLHPVFLITVILFAIVTGFLSFFSIQINAIIFNSILQLSYLQDIFLYLLFFVLILIFPVLIKEVFLNGYAEPKVLLILRTSMKMKMIEKLKKINYEHLENKNSMEVIDKTFNRLENSAIQLFPNFFFTNVFTLIFSIGVLYIFFSIIWWLPITVLFPFIAETFFHAKYSNNIYDEMESYWEKEREYAKIGEILTLKEYVIENKINASSPFLISTYKTRMKERNSQYEKYFFKNLKKQFLGPNIFKFAQIINAIILLVLYMESVISIGILISLTTTLFTTLLGYNGLQGAVLILRWGNFHANSFDFYRDFFKLSEFEIKNTISKLPSKFDIQFKNVSFKYPNTEKDILRNLSFTIKDGERVAIVGENGEGKTTLIKLLLGLFRPDKGEILIGGNNISLYSRETLSKIFGTVFQDFNRYNLTLKENLVFDGDFIESEIIQYLDINVDLNILLGKDFESGTDLSGGQWQRISIARAILKNTPCLIMDEPTSQLDPMSESSLYEKFNEISEGKTSIFITHRLGLATIVDRVFVIEEGTISMEGTHNELINRDGLYNRMYNSQKELYSNKKTVGLH